MGIGIRLRCQRAAGLLAVAAVAVVAGGAACGPPHPSLSNHSVSTCYRALPAAAAAVHDPKAHLLGVHRVPADRLHMGPAAPIPADNDTVVCAVAFAGSFRSGQVTAAGADASGRYAVVLVTAKHLRVLASYVGDQLPRSFGGRLVV